MVDRWGEEHPGWMSHVEEEGRKDGINFRWNDIHANTIDAHRIMEYAWTKNPQNQHRLCEAYMHAYFELNQNLCDKNVLCDIAEQCGYPRAEVSALLDRRNERPALVRLVRKLSHDFGCDGVPMFVFDRQDSFSGAYPVSYMERVIRQAAANA